MAYAFQVLSEPIPDLFDRFEIQFEDLYPGYADSPLYDDYQGQTKTALIKFKRAVDIGFFSKLSGPGNFDLGAKFSSGRMTLVGVGHNLLYNIIPALLNVVDDLSKIAEFDIDEEADVLKVLGPVYKVAKIFFAPPSHRQTLDEVEPKIRIHDLSLRRVYIDYDDPEEEEEAYLGEEDTEFDMVDIRLGQVAEIDVNKVEQIGQTLEDLLGYSAFVGRELYPKWKESGGPISSSVVVFVRMGEISFVLHAFYGSEALVIEILRVLSLNGISFPNEVKIFCRRSINDV